MRRGPFCFGRHLERGRILYEWNRWLTFLDEDVRSVFAGDSLRGGEA